MLYEKHEATCEENLRIQTTIDSILISVVFSLFDNKVSCFMSQLDFEMSTYDDKVRSFWFPSVILSVSVECGMPSNTVRGTWYLVFLWL